MRRFRPIGRLVLTLVLGVSVGCASLDEPAASRPDTPVAATPG